MSGPSCRWNVSTDSGVQCRVLPSTDIWKVTPSSSIFILWLSENTWKPPESVRIGPSQFMNRCRPPSRSMRSAPGRTCRW